MNDKQLQAVHDDDLVSLLTSLGIYDNLMAGRCSCLFCSKVITLNNLGAILPHQGEIAVSCNDPACLITITEESTNK